MKLKKSSGIESTLISSTSLCLEVADYKDHNMIFKRQMALNLLTKDIDIIYKPAQYQILYNHDLEMRLWSVIFKLKIDLALPSLIGTKFLPNLNTKIFHDELLHLPQTSTQKYLSVMLIGLGINPKLRQLWDSLLFFMDKATIYPSIYSIRCCNGCESSTRIFC